MKRWSTGSNCFESYVSVRLLKEEFQVSAEIQARLFWIGAITLFVLMEKTMPWGDWVSRPSGVLLVVWGVADLVCMA